MGRNGAGCHVEDRAGELTGDLVHVGDHQQETLRGSEGGGKCAGLQRPVDSSRRAAFRLHLDHERDRAPEIFLSFG